MIKSEFEKAVEAQTGLTIEQMREMPPEDVRSLREKQFNRPMEFIGGSLINFLSKVDVEKALNEALK